MQLILDTHEFFRKLLKGTSKFELAQEILENVYKVKQAFAHVRNPGIRQYEKPKELHDKFTLTREEEALATEYCYTERWKFLETNFGKLEESFIKGKVLFDMNDTIILPLRKCRVTLLIALQDLVQFKKDPAYLSETRINEIYSIISDNLSMVDDEKDQFSKYINEAVNLMIQWLKPMFTRLKVNKGELKILLKQAKDFEIIIGAV